MTVVGALTAGVAVAAATFALPGGALPPPVAQPASTSATSTTAAQPSSSAVDEFGDLREVDVWAASLPENVLPTDVAPPDEASVTKASTDPTPIPTAASQIGALGIPIRVLAAYRAAASRAAVVDPGCRLRWEVLAGIGKIESRHAYGGRVHQSGLTFEPILGPLMDGTQFRRISDQDNGRWDGNKVVDRAVGPMQFLPGTWLYTGRDGDGDGVRNPHDIDDAAFTAAAYLCTGTKNLADAAQLRAAVLTYNRSTSYVDSVLAWAQAYAKGAVPIPGASPSPSVKPSATSPRPTPKASSTPSVTSPGTTPSPSPTSPSQTPSSSPSSTPDSTPTPTGTTSATPTEPPPEPSPSEPTGEPSPNLTNSAEPGPVSTSG